MVISLDPKKRRVGFKNLKLAFPEKSAPELNRILKKSFVNFGLSLVETLILPRVFPLLAMKGFEKIPPAGGLIVGIHEGNWELNCSYFAKQRGFAVLAKRQKNKGLDKFLNEIRDESGLKVCFSLKTLVRRFEEGCVLGVVIDHGAENNAPLIDFFNHPVPTPRGAVFIARKLKIKIYPYFTVREKGFHNTLEIGDAIDPQGKTDEEVLLSLHAVYEELLYRNPEMYIWWFKRFKRKNDITAVILSDGKAGHYKQSKAFLSFLEETEYQVKSHVVDVKYRNQLSRVMMELYAFLSSKRCLGRGEFLKLFLSPSTMKILDSLAPDVVISAGSFVAAVNRVYSHYLGAKSVVLLRANIPLKKFDLAILPEHDRVNLDGGVKIKGSLFYPAALDDKFKICKEKFNLSDKKKIAVFIGGALFDRAMFSESLKLFLNQLRKFTEKKGYKILFSTSRRTSSEDEKLIATELSTFANCEAVVFANRANYDFVFDGFVKSAEIVFVSGESISMISEVLSLQKPCVALLLERLDSKYNVFLESVKDDAVILASPFAIDEIKPAASTVFDQNRKKIKEAISTLF